LIEIFLRQYKRVRQLTSSSGGSREFPFPPSLDNGRRFLVKDCFLVSGQGTLLVNSSLVQWNFVNDDIDVMYCPFGALNK
jgi:hypothetical protein